MKIKNILIVVMFFLIFITGCNNNNDKTNENCEHEYSKEWTIDKKYTTTETGLMSRHCTKCSAVCDEHIIPANYDDTIPDYLEFKFDSIKNWSYLVGNKDENREFDVLEIPYVYKNTIVVGIIEDSEYTNAKHVYNCKSLKLPFTLTHITTGIHVNKITDIEIPSSITKMSNSCWLYCDELVNVYYTGTLVDWINIAFDHHTSNPMYEAEHFYMYDESKTYKEVTEIEIPNTVTELKYDFSGFDFVKSIVIPDSVANIGFCTFIKCSSIETLEIPSSVTSIEYDAFYNCTSLKNIIVDENNPVYDSRENCNAIIETATNTLIAGCQNTTIPNSVKSIGHGAFRSCSSLTTIEIPNSVTSIGNGAFSNCTSLKNIEIPDSVVTIYNGAFEGCSNLETVKLSNNLTTINHALFLSCYKLKTIEIPSSVKTIENMVFYNCLELSSVIFKENSQLETIGQQAFTRCYNLTEIIIPNSVKKMGSDVFQYCLNLTIYLEHDVLPSDFKDGWNSSRTFYLLNEWEYDLESNPKPINA